MLRKFSIFLSISIALIACVEEREGRVVPEQTRYDLLIRNGTVYDGAGGEAFVADIAVVDDRIAAIGSGLGFAEVEIDATGFAVAPGFINVLSWANASLIEDGRPMSDIRQGVTLEVMGEGWSMGSLNEQMKRDALAQPADIRFDIEWTTPGGFRQSLQERGVSTNVASFVGATTVRIHKLGYEDRAPSAEELARMQDLVIEAYAPNIAPIESCGTLGAMHARGRAGA